MIYLPNISETVPAITHASLKHMYDFSLWPGRDILKYVRYVSFSRCNSKEALLCYIMRCAVAFDIYGILFEFVLS